LGEPVLGVQQLALQVADGVLGLAVQSLQHDTRIVPPQHYLSIYVAIAGRYWTLPTCGARAADARVRIKVRIRVL
jgi:hypothetical protein